MTLKKLENYLSVKKEIEELNEQINAEGGSMVFDKVVGSMDEYPYTKRSFQIVGLSECTQSLVSTLKRRLYAAKTEATEIEQWLLNVDDSVIRRIVELKFINGLSWKSVAIRTGYSGESGPRMALERIFEKK